MKDLRVGIQKVSAIYCVIYKKQTRAKSGGHSITTPVASG
jgi:hypothetical protein